MKKSKRNIRKIIKVISIVLVFVIVGVFSIFFSIYFSARLNKNNVIADKANVALYAANNTEIENENIARYVGYDDISPNIINAFIALEDKRFYAHSGIDYYRSAGAFINNIKAGKRKEGGSTITQQLAKNTQLSHQKTLTRKIKELKLARDIEKQYSKEEILEMYLNAIYFGNGMYGIDSACRNYFNKSPHEITVAQGAYLAGIVKSPKNYSPLNDLAKSTDRKNLVLKLMHKQGIIDQQSYQENLEYIYARPEQESLDLVTPYYSNAIVEASQILGVSEKEIMSKGYKIYTYYQKDCQEILYKAFLSREFDCTNEYNNTSSYAGMLANNSTGGITAYYSNFSNSLYSFRRQPASALKPIMVYAPALEKKIITPATPVLDEKININGYSPDNYASKYLGWIDAQTALKVSSNAVSVDLANKTGLEYSKDIASRMGIAFSQGDVGLSLALGGMEHGVNFAELSSAYMCLANMGKYTKNSFVRAIYDKNNHLVYTTPINFGFSRTISEETAYLVTDMLCQTAQDGTARKLASLDISVAAKTGTNAYPSSKNNLDAWCVSYTPDLTMCVWYGALDNAKENATNTTGGNYPALFTSYIYRALNIKNQEFLPPDGVISLDIDKYALNNEQKLYLANMFTPQECTQKVYFDAHNAPSQYSPYFDFENFHFAVHNTLSDGVNIVFKGVKPYKNKLFRQDMLTGEVVEINIDSSDNEVSHFDHASEMGAYNYYVEFFYGEEKLNYSPNQVVFT